MRTHLQVKVFTLMQEMSYIRRKEEKWKTRARIARKNQKQSSQDRAEAAFWSLRGHRTGLKSEARNIHLAYGALRGVSYSRMEVMCYGPLKGYGSTEPNWKSIEDMVERFSKDEDDSQGTMQRFGEWLADAKVWYEGNSDRIKAWNKQRPQRIEALKALKKPYVAA